MTRKEGVFACIQEIKWSGKSARELGEGFKIFYSGERNTRNVVGVILNPELKTKMIEVERPGDSVIKLRLIFGGEVYNIMSVYGPGYTGCKVRIHIMADIRILHCFDVSAVS